MVRVMRAWLMTTAIAYLIFYFGELMTVSVEADASAVNPYWFVLLFGFPFLLLFAGVTVRVSWLATSRLARMFRVLMLVGSSTMVYVLLRLNLDRSGALREALRESGQSDVAEGWSQFTNIVYFNQLTFVIVLLICIAVGTVFGLIRPRSSEEDGPR